MAEKHGALSINSDNIFPIIKKWLYSDHDIFYRELISNGCDAITKLKKLDMMGEYELPEGYKPRVDVIVDPDAKTIRFIDNGVGMTADEVEEYINQIAFSGATDFIAKYKDKTNDDQIIGHFGLGFYSAFMVADEVHIDTLSWQKDAKPVVEGFMRWLDGQYPEKGSRMDRAVTYIRNRKDTLMTYLEDGRCSLSNNPSENSLRLVTLGRKNWLFSDSPEDANASMVVYTMVEMAKAYGLHPYNYLKYLLDSRPGTDTTDAELKDLVPWNEKARIECNKKLE